MQQVVVDQLLPALREVLPDYHIAWSHDQQLKPTAMNARRVMTQQQTVAGLGQQLASATCGCARFRDTYKVCIADDTIQQHCPAAYNTKHVLTTDLSVVKHTNLRSLLAQGLNHIPMRSAAVQEIIDLHQQVAGQFYDRVLQPTAAATGFILQPDGREIICNGAAVWVEEQLGEGGCGWGADAVRDEYTAETAEALAALQQYLHICEVDKAASTPCFICPQYAQLLVLLRLSASADFGLVHMDTSEVQASLQAELAAIHPMLRQTVEGDKLPIMRIAYKSHKNSFRFLTNTAGSLLSGLNEVAQEVTSCVQQEVIAALGNTNEAFKGLVGTATQTCIVITNAQQVAVNLPDRIHTDTCADITKCFENIPTQPGQPDSLPKALRWAVSKAFRHRAAAAKKPQVIAVILHNDRIKAAWQHLPARGAASSSTRMYLQEEAVIALLTSTVTNAYVTAAGNIYRQSRGIPMGANYSPNVCNLYFMKYESQAVLRMQRLAETPELCRQLLGEWRYCFRMIDDMRFINAPTLAGYIRNPVGTGSEDAIGWIYPPCVGIDITSDVSAAAAANSSQVQDTQYLDLLTHIHPDGTYDVEVYDKQSKLTIQPINYITCDSNRPVTNSYKLILGQASRIAAICSKPHLAAKHIGVVIRKLSNRGFKTRKLARVLSQWATHNAHIPGKSFNMTDVTTLLLHVNRRSSSRTSRR